MTQNEHVCAIYCRLEAADDIIAGKDVGRFHYYACVNLRVAILMSFEKIYVSHVYNA